MFSTRHLTSLLTLTALTCTSAALYSSQAQTQALNTSEAVQSTKPTEAASKIYFNTKDRYNAFAATQAKLNASISNVEIDNLTNAVNLFSQLFNDHDAFKKSLNSLEKDKLDGFVTYITLEHPTENIDKDFTAAQRAVENFRNKLLQQLANRINDLATKMYTGNKATLEALLKQDLPDLEALFKKIPGAETAAEYEHLQIVRQKLEERIAELTAQEKASTQAKKLADEEAAQRERDRIAAEEVQRQAAELARQNTPWKKFTRVASKYGIPVVVAFSVAAGLTYGETKHKFFSKLIWGKQPEKVIQLSWWARWWTGLKRVLRFA